MRDGRVELVDESTGRVAERRHWPDGLHAAVEAKEGLRLTREGRILGPVTLQHFLSLYPRLAGMTATAQGAADELALFYGLAPWSSRRTGPTIREDLPDVVFTHLEAKEAALVGVDPRAARARAGRCSSARRASPSRSGSPRRSSAQACRARC